MRCTALVLAIVVLAIVVLAIVSLAATRWAAAAVAALTAAVVVDLYVCARRAPAAPPDGTRRLTVDLSRRR